MRNIKSDLRRFESGDWQIAGAQHEEKGGKKSEQKEKR